MYITIDFPFDQLSYRWAGIFLRDQRYKSLRTYCEINLYSNASNGQFKQIFVRTTCSVFYIPMRILFLVFVYILMYGTFQFSVHFVSNHVWPSPFQSNIDDIRRVVLNVTYAIRQRYISPQRNIVHPYHSHPVRHNRVVLFDRYLVDSWCAIC